MTLIQAIGGPIDGTFFTHPNINMDDPDTALLNINTVLIDEEPKPTNCQESKYKLVKTTWGRFEYHFVPGSIVTIPCPDMQGEQIVP